ncbi:MAG TPA: MFS transporter, partial [Nitrococcus sp.]|nr:MFS transporter [Nitrococcus sp.]
VAGCAILMLIGVQAWLLIPLAVIGGFGRGAINTPFAPAEQAWLSDAVPRRLRSQLYSLGVALGLTGMAVGAVLGMLPDLIKHWLPGALAYRPLFVIVTLSSVAAFLTVLPTRELRRYRVERGRADTALQSRQRDENRLLLRLTAINALNGLGIGLTGPLIAYWFNLRFGMGPVSIAPVMALAFAAAALASLGTGRLTLRVGVMRAVIGARALAVVLLLALPLVPSFTWAAALYIVRMALNRGTIGARQGLNIGLVGPARRGVAASVSSVSVQVPRAAGPGLAGILFASGTLGVPFYLAAALQAAYLVLYNRSFRAHDPVRPSARSCRTRSR